MKKQRILFWVDLEMTGLSDEQVIIEIASLVTDAELNILGGGGPGDGGGSGGGGGGQ